MALRTIQMDSQLLTAVQTCALKAHYSYNRNLRLTGEVPEAIERGDLGHQMLEIFYVMLGRNEPFETAQEAAIVHGRKHYAGLSLDISVAEWMVETFRQYTEHFKHDGIEVLDVEKAFANLIYEDDEIELYYTGKIDLVCNLPGGLNGVWIDHKTRARKNDETNLNNQFIGYAHALSAPVGYVNEIGLQTSKKPSEKFRRMPLSFSKGFVQQWVNNTIYWGKQLDFYLQNQTWPQQFNPMICKGCVFAGLCQSDNDEVREFKIQTQFYERVWDPTAGLSED